MNPSGNVVLIGMPGSGKSTIGVLLAKVLGLDFVDTDVLLQKQERRLLREILAEKGPAGFLKAEDKMLAGFQGESTVVSTGGSAVYHHAGMTNLRQGGQVVWLDVGLKELEKRLGDMAARGVVLAPGQTLADLYTERQPLYEKWAEIRLEVKSERLETTVTRLVELIRPAL